MQNPPPVQTTKSSTGLDENIAALLSYVLGWIGGLIFFLIEKDSRLVRFHAMQSLRFNVLVGVVAIVVWVVWMVFFIVGSAIGDIVGGLVGIIGTLLWVVFFIGVAVAWIMCLVKAFQSQYWKLPIIGNFAEKFSAK